MPNRESGKNPKLYLFEDTRAMIGLAAYEWARAVQEIAGLTEDETTAIEGMAVSHRMGEIEAKRGNDSQATSWEIFGKLFIQSPEFRIASEKVSKILNKDE